MGKETNSISLIEMAKELYLNSGAPKESDNTEEVTIYNINLLRTEAYVLGGLKVLNIIEELLDVGCDDIYFDELLRDRIKSLRGDIMWK